VELEGYLKLLKKGTIISMSMRFSLFNVMYQGMGKSVTYWFKTDGIDRLLYYEDEKEANILGTG